MQVPPANPLQNNFTFLLPTPSTGFMVLVKGNNIMTTQKQTLACIFGDFQYTPITPQADTDKLAENTARIILQHRRNYERGGDLIYAKQGELTSGWVVGIVNPDALQFTQQAEYAALCAVAEAAERLSKMLHDMTTADFSKGYDKPEREALARQLSRLANIRKG